MKIHKHATKIAAAETVPGTAIPVDQAAAGLARPALEPAVVKDRGPGGVAVLRRVRRRAPAPVIARLPESRRLAAETYAAAYEAVQAGGSALPFASEKVDGGVGCAEGPQARATAAAGHLARMNAAIGLGAVRLDARGNSVSIRALVVTAAVAGVGLPRMFDALDIRRTAQRERRVAEAIADALGRVAVVLGYEMP